MKPLLFLVFFLCPVLPGCGGEPSIGCLDADGDGYGSGTCPEKDCNDSDRYCWAGLCCPRDCTDADLDGYGEGPDCLGADCDDGNPLCWDSTSCCPRDCLDEDGDGYGQGSDCQGSDCNDQDPDCWSNDACCLASCTDADGDGFGEGSGCEGADCDDDNPHCWNNPTCCPSGCIDEDGDGYGEGLECIWFDCDDNDPLCWEGACCQPECIDEDGDGYGEGPGCLGPDCDEEDPGCFDGDCCNPPDAILEIYSLDIWAQPLPEAGTELSIYRDGQPLAIEPDATSPPVTSLPLRGAGSYQVVLSAPDHHTLIVTVRFEGGSDLSRASLLAGPEVEGHGLSLSHDVREVEGRPTTFHTLYLGLRHKWFSAQGRPARRGHHVDLLIAGEESWNSVYNELVSATGNILISTWWWMSHFELIRDWNAHAYLTEEERWAYTALGILENSPARVRVLVGEFWGDHDILDWITTDEALLAYAEQPDDGFEFMGEGNTTSGVFWFEAAPFVFGDRIRDAHPESAGRLFDPEEDILSTVPPRWVDMTEWPVSVEVQIAAWHQKLFVIDDRVAFITGMNVKTTDWDSTEHLVFDHRRMSYDASVAEREAVMNKEDLPDYGPRRDYMVRIDGPAVQDVSEIFHQRWIHQIEEGATFSENSTDFVFGRDQAAHEDGIQVQVTTTMPEPFWEHSIAETWFNAIKQAEHFIFVEDQYWRIPMLVDAIVERMHQVPELLLLVVTKPVSEWFDPGCEWTHATHQRLLAEFPTRYGTYQLRSFDTTVTWGIDETESRFEDIDLHAKMLIVDDKFLSVGSCNKNNRGLVYEGELNLAVVDPGWVREQRRRIFANLLPGFMEPTDAPVIWWNQFAYAAYWNDIVYFNWEEEGWDIDLGDGTDPLPAAYKPDGLIYSLDFGTVDDCLIEGVGPDMTR